jgi:hypothetical protein
VQQLSLRHTMAAGAQHDVIGQIAIGLSSHDAREREDACLSLSNVCGKGECVAMHARARARVDVCALDPSAAIMQSARISLPLRLQTACRSAWLT